MDVCSRFKEELGSKVVEDFHKLQQWGSVEDYLEKFEGLKSLMLQRTPILPDDYFITSFIAGLKPHLKPFVKALNPLTLDDAIHFTRLQEEAAEAFRLNRPPAVSRPPLLPTPGGSQRGGVQSVASSSLSNTRAIASGANHGVTSSASSVGSVTKPLSHSFRPTRLISAAERADKIAKGLCYFCDQPYERGHKCPTKQSQLFLVEVPAEVDSEKIEDGENDSAELDGKSVGFEMIETEPCISLQAINGVQGFQTMRVTGYVGKKAIQILIDSGSTHNFVDVNLVQRLGCKMEPIHLQSVAVADGSALRCSYMCRQFVGGCRVMTFVLTCF